MNTLIIVLFSILGPICFVALSISCYIVLKSYYLKKYSKYLNELEQFLTSEPYIETLTMLRTVDISLREQEKTLMNKIISLPNDEIQINDVKMEQINESKENFATKTIDIEEKIKRLNSLKNNLIDNLENAHVFSCRRIILNVEDEKKQMEIIKKIVSDQTKEFIDPIIDFEEKKQKYVDILNSIELESKKWNDEVNSDIFKKNIEEKIINIKQHLNEAIDSISYRDSERTFRLFTTFKKSLFDLVQFGNYFDNFYDILFVKTSEKYSNVMDYLNKIKNNVNSDLDMLNINTFLKNFDDEFALAKENFYSLNIKKTEENIEKYFNTLLGLTYVLTQELKAFNFFSQYGISNIHNIYSNAIEKFNNIKSSCEKLLSIDKFFYWNLQTNNINNLEELLKKINDGIVSFNEENESQIILYSKRQSKYKNILQLLLQLFYECEHVERSIDIFYIEGASQLLKYHNLKKTYIEGLSKVKQTNIKLDITDTEIINLIEKKKQKIEQNILNLDNYSDRELKKDVDIFFKLMVSFVLKVLKKVLILKAFSLIMIDNSYRRFESNLFDKKVIESENYILEGQYLKGLHNLVSAINGGNN